MAELGLAGSLWLVIGVSLLNVALMVRLVERVTGSVVPPVLALVYMVLLFGQPEFYFNHRHDTLSVLSCCYLLLGWDAWYGFRETGRRGYLAAWVLCAVLLCFTKETYWLASLLFCFWQVIEAKREQRPWETGATAALLAAMALALLHNRTANSPFVNVKNDPANPYFMSLAPASLAHGLWFYLSNLWTIPSALLILAGVIRGRRFGLLLLLAGTAALLTHSVLPNHLDLEYAWAGAVLSFAPVLLLPRSWAWYGGAAALTAATLWLYRPGYQPQKWMAEQEQINRNTLASFGKLTQVRGRVLVSGLQSAFQPFLVGDYVASVFGRETQWTVVVPRETAVKNDPPIRLVHGGDVQASAVNHVFGYDEQGRLVLDLDQAQLQGDAWRVPELQPHLAALAKDPRDFYALLKAGALYWEWGMREQAKEYLVRAQAASDGKNGYPAYFLGQIAEDEKNVPAARRYYEQAIAADQPTPNPVFTAALARLP